MQLVLPSLPAIVLMIGVLAYGQESRPAPRPIAPLKVDQAALDKLGWRLGCQAWTFRGLSLFETLDVLHAMGIRYIELYPGQRFSPDKPDVKFDHYSPPELVDALIVKLKETGVKPASYGVVGLSADEAQSRKVFEFAKKLGLEQIVSEPPVDAFATLDKLANEYKIPVAIHDHPKPSHYWNPDAVLAACEGRSNMIGACADVGHWARSGLVPADCLKKLQGKIIELHMKDVDDKNEDVVWGSGRMDMKAVLVELKRQGVRPIFFIEYETGTGDELIGNVTRSVENFSAMSADLAK